MKKVVLGGVVLLAAALAFVRWDVGPESEPAHIVARDTTASETVSSGDVFSSRPGDKPPVVPTVAGDLPEAAGVRTGSAPENTVSGSPASEESCWQVGADPSGSDGRGIGGSEASNGADDSAGKESCYNTRKLLADAWSIFEVSEVQSVWYSTGGPIDGGSTIRDVLLPRICVGSEEFIPSPEPVFELVVVNSTSNARILVGQNWVSDGTIRSPLTESEYSRLAGLFHERQQNGIGDGANSARAEFERRLRKGDYNRMATARETERRASEELRRAQQRRCK